MDIKKLSSEDLSYLMHDLFIETEKWKYEGGFKHRKPCSEWKRGLNCKHYAKARYLHFKEKYDTLLYAAMGLN
jgi:hypothetical protein